MPLSSAPRLFARSLLVTTSFVFVIVGVQQGSPVVVQTMVATTPLFVLAVEGYRTGTRPTLRALGAASGGGGCGHRAGLVGLGW